MCNNTHDPVVGVCKNTPDSVGRSATTSKVGSGGGVRGVGLGDVRGGRFFLGGFWSESDERGDVSSGLVGIELSAPTVPL